MKRKRIVAFLVMIVLTVSCVKIPVFAKSAKLTDYEHEIVDFSSLKYVHYDTAVMEEKIARLEEICSDEKNIDEVMEIIIWLEAETDKLETSEILSYYNFKKNISDKYWEEEYLYSSSKYQEIISSYQEAGKKVALSPCKAAFEEFLGEAGIEYVQFTQAFSQEEIENREMDKLLYTQYRALLDQEFKTDCLGKTYTMDSLTEEYTSGILSDSDFLDIYNKLYHETSLAFSDIYFKTIENNNSFANMMGFDNYMDYGYLVNYGRDYTPNDAMVLCKNIREKLSPYSFSFNEYNSPMLQDKAKESISEGVDVILGRCMEQMTPELKECYDYMMETNSLDIQPDLVGVSAYTNRIPEYNMPYIFLERLDNAAMTLTDAFHEFGHYNSFYWTNPGIISYMNNDLSETYSQGMELLATHFYDEIYNEASTSAEKYVLGRLLFVLYSSAFIAELEYTAYTGDFKTAEELCTAIETVLRKHYPNGADWYTITHIFESPSYYISYAVAAINALEIYLMSKEDFDAALDSYITLLSDQFIPYKQLMKKAGLTTEWTKKSLNKFLDKLINLYIDTDAPVIEGVEDGGRYLTPVSIKVKDDSLIYVFCDYEGDTYNMTSREFELSGANYPYSIYVIDGFGNETTVSFEIEPELFAVSVTENESDEHVLSWNKIAYAEYYKVYGAPLGQKYKKLGTVKNGGTSFVNKNADERIWKYYVVACCKIEGQEHKLAKSVKSFVACSNSKTYTNSKSIEIMDGETIDLETGSKKKLTVIETLEDDSKKRFTSKNVKAIRYYSSDTNVAEVSKKGVITAKSEGVCYILCTTENGLTDKIKVTVG